MQEYRIRGRVVLDKAPDPIERKGKTSSDYLPWIFAALCLVLGFAYMFMITFFKIPEGNARYADTVLGFLLGTVVSTVINYFFGSSKSSADKSSTIEKLK